MKELEKSQQVINARGWEEICKPYVEEVFLAVAYRGEVTQHEESETWLYNPKGRVSDEKIGYYIAVNTKSGESFTEFWSVAKAQEMASRLSKMYNEKKGVWYENFDAVTLKKLETLTLREVYLFCNRNNNN